MENGNGKRINLNPVYKSALRHVRKTYIEPDRSTTEGLCELKLEEMVCKMLKKHGINYGMNV